MFQKYKHVKYDTVETSLLGYIRKRKEKELHGCLRGSGFLVSSRNGTEGGVLRDDKWLRVIELCELSVKTASTVLGLRQKKT